MLILRIGGGHAGSLAGQRSVVEPGLVGGQAGAERQGGVQRTAYGKRKGAKGNVSVGGPGPPAWVRRQWEGGKGQMGMWPKQSPQPS